MGLAPAQPDQALIDGLSLDAAWERTKDLERRVNELQLLLKSSKEAYEKLAGEHSKLHGALGDLILEYRGHAIDSQSMARIVAELTEIFYKEA